MRDGRSYVHRGDAARRARRRRRLLLLAGLAMSAGALWLQRAPAPANAEPAVRGPLAGLFASREEVARLENELESARGVAATLEARVGRAQRIIDYSTRFGIPAGLAASVLDVSLAEGIDPELAFRLVHAESRFNPRAVSPAGALGLTQLMPTTATRFDPRATRDRLFEPRTNLRIGFRYLRTLLDLFDGDVRAALLAYNRGEVAVARDLRQGRDPSNGYDRLLLRGYAGRGRID